MKKLLTAIALTAGLTLTAACDSDAEVASENLSKAADQFEINRRVIFYNGITNEYILTIEGFCSIEDEGIQLEVTCRVDDEGAPEHMFKKHFLGLSDNVTYFVEQLEAAGVSTDHYRVIFKPEVIVPDIDRP